MAQYNESQITEDPIICDNIKNKSSADRFILAKANLICSKNHNIDTRTKLQHLKRAILILLSIKRRHMPWHLLIARCFMLTATLYSSQSKNKLAKKYLEKIDSIFQTYSIKSLNNSAKMILSLSNFQKSQIIYSLEKENIFPNYQEQLLSLNKTINYSCSIMLPCQKINNTLLLSYKYLAVTLYQLDRTTEALAVLKAIFTFYNDLFDKSSIFKIIQLLEITAEFYINPVYDAPNLEKARPYYTMLFLLNPLLPQNNINNDFLFDDLSDLLIYLIESKIDNIDFIKDITNYILFILKYYDTYPTPTSDLNDEINDPESREVLIDLILELLFIFSEIDSSPYSNILFNLNLPIDYSGLMDRYLNKPKNNIYYMDEYITQLATVVH